MKKTLNALLNLDTLVAGVGLVLIVVVTVAGVFMRKVMGRPFAWMEEMQIFFFIWTIFFGGSVAFRTGSQVSIDLIAVRLSPRARRILDIVDYLITVLVLAYLTKGGYQLMMSVTKKVTPYFKISYSLIDLAVPIGCVLMIIQYSLIAWDKFLRNREAAQEEGAEA